MLVDRKTDQWSILLLMTTLPNMRDLLEGHITLELSTDFAAGICDNE